MIVKYREKAEFPQGAISPIIRRASDYEEIDFKTTDLDIIQRISEDFMRLDILKWDPPEEVPLDIEENLKRFKAYVMNEEYWYAHEELEAIWKAENGPDKEILRMMILLMASMVKYQMSSMESAVRLFQESSSFLSRHLYRGDNLYFSYPLPSELITSLMSYLDRYASNK